MTETFVSEAKIVSAVTLSLEEEYDLLHTAWCMDQIALDKANREIATLKEERGESGFSGCGINVRGDRASIDKVAEAVYAQSTIPAYRERIKGHTDHGIALARIIEALCHGHDFHPDCEKGAPYHYGMAVDAKCSAAEMTAVAQDWERRAVDAEARIEALTGEVERKDKALRPFASAAHTLDAKTRRTLQLPADSVYVNGITLGECRAAARALSQVAETPVPSPSGEVG